MLTISELKLTKEHDIARFFVVVLNIEFIPEYVDHQQDDNKETKSGGYQWESDDTLSWWNMFLELRHVDYGMDNIRR